MRNSQTELLYRGVYARAYRRRHPRRNRLNLLSVIVSFVMAGILIVTLTDIVEAAYSTYGRNEASEIQAEIIDITVDSISKSPTPLQSEILINAQSISLEVGEEITSSFPTNTAPADAVAPENEPSLGATEDSNLAYLEGEESPGMGERTALSSTDQRAVLTASELKFFEQVVEAEVTGTTYKYAGEFVDESQMLLSKVRVAQVFLNRVDDTEKFARITTLYEAISESGASSTVLSGRCYEVEVTDLTKQAVKMALDANTEDYTDGALFFLAGGATTCKYGSYLFTDDVGHSFFK